MQMVVGNEPRFREFLKTSSMTLSVYHLPVGSEDMQAPHYEDEVYVVLSGRATLQVEDKEYDVAKGSVLFVRANTGHSFFDIKEDLTVLAVFSDG